MSEREEYQQEKSGKILINWFQRRYIIGIICSIGAIIVHICRCCTSVIMVRLVKRENITLTERAVQCPLGLDGHDEIGNPFTADGGEFGWSSHYQKMILLFFYVGYLATHVPMGVLSERCGFKWPLLSTVLLTGIVTATTPIVIDNFGDTGLMCMNAFLGATQGGLIPSLAVLLARWYPQNERSRFGASLIGGGILGNAIALILNQLLMSYDWPMIYYISTGLAVVWCIIFVIFCYNAPENHPFISRREKTYLAENIDNLSPYKSLPPTPWKPMFTSLPVWAYIVMHIGHDWVLYGMLLDVPTYTQQVLRFTHKEVVLWTVIPLILLWLTTIVWGIFSDIILMRELISLSDLRKLNTLFAVFGPGLFLLFSSYARCHHVLAIIFFTLCMCATGPFFSGAKLSAVDLCPNYAGTLMGISDGLGCLGAIAPSVLNVVSDRSGLAEWRNVFWLDFAVITSTAVIYLLFGSSELQEWNSP